MFIEPGSREYILIPVTGPQTDLTLYAGEVALISPAQAENGGPTEGDWVTGVWVPGTGGTELGIMHNPGTWPAGVYVAYARLAAGEERPVMKAGRVQIGHP